MIKYHLQLIVILTFLSGVVYLWRGGKNIVLSQVTTTPIIEIDDSQSSTDSATVEKEENIFEEEVAGVATGEADILPSVDLLPLKERRMNKNIKVNKQTRHSCAAENFIVDISLKKTEKAKILLKKKEVTSGKLEIGNLPAGIDVFFSQNKDYVTLVNEKSRYVELEISKQDGAQKGSFNLPIFYLDDDSQETTVCQIGVVNL